MLEARVINRFRDKYTRRIYKPGETYQAETEARMVELASLDPPRVAWPPQVETPGPRHVGGGWYELPDGTRIRGKENAARVMENGAVG